MTSRSERGVFERRNSAARVAVQANLGIEVLVLLRRAPRGLSIDTTSPAFGAPRRAIAWFSTWRDGTGMRRAHFAMFDVSQQRR
jgi:hypothetical protein